MKVVCDTRIRCVLFGTMLAGLAFVSSCGKSAGYSNEWLYPENVESVYVEMFENDSFRRGIEYELTDALAKRIEAETPYKIVSDRDLADTVISGKVLNWSDEVLSFERQTGRPLEQQAEVVAVVNWKNLKTGQMMIEHKPISDAMSYTVWLNQSFEYASTVTANRIAERIVEQMQTQW